MGSPTSEFASWIQAHVTTTAASTLTASHRSVGQARQGSGSTGRRPRPRRGIGSTQRAISTASLGTVRRTNQSFCWGSLTTSKDVDNTMPRSSRNKARGIHSPALSPECPLHSWGSGMAIQDGFVPTSILPLPCNIIPFTYWEL